MSTYRILALAGGLFAFTVAANAQTTVQEPVQPSMPGMTEQNQPVMDREIFAHFILNQNEGRFDRLDLANTLYRWDGEGWIGTDYDKFRIKTEGFVKGGKVEDGQQQFLYSRAVTTYFDVQAGLRSDLDSRPTRNWAAFGIEGLAPYFFETSLTGYARPDGRLAARAEASYGLLITNRLILQPQIELNFYSRSDKARGIGAGLSDIDTGFWVGFKSNPKIRPLFGGAL